MHYKVILALLFVVYSIYFVFLSIKVNRCAFKHGIYFYKESLASVYRNDREALNRSRKISSYFLSLDIYRLFLFIFFYVFFNNNVYNLDMDFVYFFSFVFIFIFLFFFSHKLFLFEMKILENDRNNTRYTSYIDADVKFDYSMGGSFDVLNNKFVIVKSFFSRYLFLFYFIIIFILVFLFSVYFLFDQHFIFFLYCLSFCLLIIVGSLFIFLFKLLFYLIRIPRRISFDEMNLYVDNYVFKNDCVDFIEIYDIFDLYGNRVRYFYVKVIDCSYIFYLDVIMNDKINFSDFDDFVLSFEKKYSYKVKFFSEF